MKVLDGQAQLCDVELGLVFREGNLTGKMEAEIAARTVVESEVEVVRGLKGEVKVDDELVVCLLEDIGFYDGVFELLLKDKVFLLECL